MYVFIWRPFAGDQLADRIGNGTSTYDVMCDVGIREVVQEHRELRKMKRMHLLWRVRGRWQDVWTSYHACEPSMESVIRGQDSAKREVYTVNGGGGGGGGI